MNFIISATTDVGTTKQTNQNSLTVKTIQTCQGRMVLAVLCDGTAVPCCLDGEGRMALGNLFDQPVEEILASPRAAAIREGFSRRSPAEELCRRCGYAARF